MKFSAIITTLACAEAALAARFTEARRQRAAERSAARDVSRSSNPRLPSEDGIVNGLALDNVTQVSYSSNWAGAVLIGSVSCSSGSLHGGANRRIGLQICDWYLRGANSLYALRRQLQD
jgi:hypothetical protein